MLCHYHLYHDIIMYIQIVHTYVTRAINLTFSIFQVPACIVNTAL